MNAKLEYIEGMADKAHRTLEKLITRYEDATNENYQIILDQIAKAEKDIEKWEAAYDEEFQNNARILHIA